MVLFQPFPAQDKKFEMSSEKGSLAEWPESNKSPLTDPENPPL